MKREIRNRRFICVILLLCGMALAFLLYPMISLAVAAVTTYLRAWGVLPGIGVVALRTLLLLVLTVALVLPLSFGIFRLLRRRARWEPTVRHSIAGVSRVPAVLMGFIGYLIIRNHANLRGRIFPMAVLLAVMFIPSCLFHMEQAIDSLPEEYRMAGEALGGSVNKVLLFVLIPVAKPELLRTGLELIEDILCEATALLVLMGAIDEGQVLSTELFRLAYLGRADAAVLAFLLMAALILLRFFTARRFRREKEDSLCRYNWW